MVGDRGPPRPLGHPLLVLTLDPHCSVTVAARYTSLCVRDGLAARRVGRVLAIGFASEARVRAEAERVKLFRFSTNTGAWEDYAAGSHATFAPAAGAGEDVFSMAERQLLLEGAVGHLRCDASITELPVCGELRPHAPDRDALWLVHGGSLQSMLGDAVLDSTAAYLGSETALYFAWLQQALRWYAPVGLVGLCVFAYHRVFQVSIDDSTVASIFSFYLCLWAAAQYHTAVGCASPPVFRCGGGRWNWSAAQTAPTSRGPASVDAGACRL